MPFMFETPVMTRSMVTIETIYTPTALLSCGRVCIDFQWLLSLPNRSIRGVSLGKMRLGTIKQGQEDIDIWRQNSEQRSRIADIVESILRSAILFEQQLTQKSQSISPVTRFNHPDLLKFAECFIYCRPRDIECRTDVSIMLWAVSETLDDRCAT